MLNSQTYQLTTCRPVPAAECREIMKITLNYMIKTNWIIQTLLTNFLPAEVVRLICLLHRMWRLQVQLTPLCKYWKSWSYSLIINSCFEAFGFPICFLWLVLYFRCTASRALVHPGRSSSCSWCHKNKPFWGLKLMWQTGFSPCSSLTASFWTAETDVTCAVIFSQVVCHSYSRFISQACDHWSFATLLSPVFFFFPICWLSFVQHAKADVWLWLKYLTKKSHYH